MTERMDLMVARKAGEKTYWSKIGVAFQGQKGWKITFEALPIPDDRGQVTAFLFPPQPKRDEPSFGSRNDDNDSGVPF